MLLKAKIDIKYYLIAIAVGLAIFGSILAYWSWGSFEVITFKGEYKTEKLIYSKGEETFYSVDYCKLLDAKVVSISKEFVDGLVFEAESPQASLYPGCRAQEVPLKIPNTLPAGKFRLRVTIIYQVTPTQTKTYTHYSNWFEVRLEPVTHLDAEQDLEQLVE